MKDGVRSEAVMACDDLRGGGRKVGGGISQQLFAFILFQYISNFPFPLGASQFPASISFHT